MTKKYATIDEYVSAFPEDVQHVLEQVRSAARNAAPESGETISYDMPAITLNGEDLVYFAAWKHHITVYAVPVADDGFEQELAPYRTAKGALRFPLAKPLPDEVIARLMTLCVKQRVASRT